VGRAQGCSQEGEVRQSAGPLGHGRGRESKSCAVEREKRDECEEAS
jgi:hypothetical protein